MFLLYSVGLSKYSAKLHKFSIPPNYSSQNRQNLCSRSFLTHPSDKSDPVRRVRTVLFPKPGEKKSSGSARGAFRSLRQMLVSLSVEDAVGYLLGHGLAAGAVFPVHRAEHLLLLDVVEFLGE